MQTGKIPEIWETDDDKLLSVNKLRERNIEYARSHFIKKPHLVVENQETNMEDRNYFAGDKGMEAKIAYQTSDYGYQLIGC